MKKIERIEIEKTFTRFQAEGLHVDRRLLAELKKEGEYFMIDLEDEDSFYSLIWQQSDQARLLTPSDQPCCLSDIGKRFNEMNYTFDQLSKPMHLPRSKHDPNWFIACEKIYSTFDIEKFGIISVVPANDNEQKQSTAGSFYIFDGMHKTLVLAVKLLNHEITFSPIKVLLMLPRRNG